MLKLIIISLSLLAMSVRSFAQLEVPADLHFKTLHTPHFEVIYNAEQQEVGQLYAEKLEKAYQALLPFFSIQPEKTVVIINDKTDITNGYATKIPYPHIMVFPVLPGPQESLADGGDWAFELVAHEYTHILNFEPATGAAKYFRNILGSIAAPNILLPTWWKEGLAVQMETRVSNKGRLRSAYQDAMIRSFTEAHRLLNFTAAEINEFIPSWPEGMRPYLFGSTMWSFMVASKGDQVIDSLNRRHAGRVPYFIEAPAEDLLGNKYNNVFIDSLIDTNHRAEKQIAQLKTAPPTPYILVKNKSTYVSDPSLSYDGQFLSIISVNSSNKREIKIFKKNTKTQSFVGAHEIKTAEGNQELNIAPSVFDGPPSGSIQRVEWLHLSNQLVYDKIDVTNRVESFSDLYLYNMNTQKTERLSHGLRGREPTASLDDQKVVFVKLSGAKTQLAEMNLQNKNIEILYSPAIQERISYPSYLSDEQIILSKRDAAGEENLFIFDKKTKQLQIFAKDYPDARFAKVIHQDGFTKIAFTSSKNGTHNIYLSDLEGSRITPLTHVVTALFSFDRDAQSGDIYATHLGPEGPELVYFSKENLNKTPPQLPTVQGLFADRYPPQKQEATNSEMTSPHFEETDYSAGSYLWPQYWIPFIGSSSSNSGFVFQVLTSGFDPLKKHNYSLLGSWDSGLGSGSATGSYTNQQTNWPITLMAYQKNSYFGTIDNKYTENGVSLSAWPDTFASLGRYTTLQGGVLYNERKTDYYLRKRQGLFAYLDYSNYTRSGTQISPESGYGAYAGAYDYLPQTNFIDHTQYLAGGTVYFSKWLPDRHAIMLKTNLVYTPEVIPASLGAQTDSLFSLLDSSKPSYVLRGYKSGQLYGKDLISANLEYRFPLKDIYSGSGTDPIFLKRLTGAAVLDIASADGYFVNDVDLLLESVNTKRMFLSYGGEVKMDTTIGYVFPISFVLGYYYAPNAPGHGASSIGTNLIIGGF